MKNLVTEPVAQPDENSVQTDLTNENNSSSTNKYKEDMFRYKQLAKDRQAQLDAIALEGEQKKGNFEGVIGSLKDKVSEYQKENAELKQTFAENVLDKAIENMAISKGLKGTQLEVFTKLIDHDAKGVVEFDERFNAKSEDVANLVDDHMKRYGEIFKLKANVIDQSPNNNPINRPSGKEFNKKTASADEIVAHLLANQDKLK
jgi:hypothetical protein